MPVADRFRPGEGLEAARDRGAALAREAPAPAQGRLLIRLRTMSPKRVRQIRRAVDDLVSAMEAEDVEARFFFAEG